MVRREGRDMVSDAELVERLRGFLRASDLSTTTTTAVRRRLEYYFGVDLSDKKAFVRPLVDLFLSRPQGQQGGEETPEKEEDQEGSGEEEEEGGEEDGGSGEVLEEEEEEEGEDEERSNEGSNKKRESNKLSDVVRKRGGGFTKLCSLSPLLQDFVGKSELARTEVLLDSRELDVYDKNKRVVESIEMKTL